ncbi:MAG TPA: hypothetical protein PKK43_13810, partial [Spirochaetota bacterium]|nr:hypothetical protein [Spirochaetota bacterium]
RLYDEICETTPGNVRIEDRWWFRFKNTSTGDEIISYRLLLSAPKDAITAALRTAIEKVKDKTPEETNRKTEITAWIENGLPGLPSIPKKLRKAN